MPENIDYIFIALGALTSLIIVSYIPGTVATLSMNNKFQSQLIQSNDQLKLEDIKGIDLNSLKIIRDNKLI